MRRHTPYSPPTHRNRRALGVTLLVALAAFGLGAGQLLAQGGAAPAAGGDDQAPEYAVAYLQPTEGSSVRGVVTFAKAEGGIRVVATVSGLTPGQHGFHVHQFGDCSAPDGTSAGGHFNPEGVMHGGPDSPVRHVGDLGNIEADASGNATYDRVDPMLSFEGSHSILGRGMIVHAGQDDLTTQPTGAAGARAACGVIGVGSPPTE